MSTDAPAARDRAGLGTGGRPFAVAQDDTGMTLMDLLVSMSIMAVVASMLTAGIVQLHRMTARAEANSVAQSQVAVALTRMDRQVRYATRISVAGSGSVTYEVVEKNATRCYQTRLAAGRLQQRSRPAGGSYGSWATLASGTTGTFTFHAPTDANGHQRLQVRLTATAPGGSAATKHTDVTFTARNTTRTSATTAC